MQLFWCHDVRMVNKWNSLLGSIVNIHSTNVLKNRYNQLEAKIKRRGNLHEPLPCLPCLVTFTFSDSWKCEGKY